MIGKIFNHRIIMVVLTVLLLSTLTCGAQRRNRMGYKMVAKVTFQCFNSKGVECKDFAREIIYLYDDDDKLIGIDDTEHLEDGDWAIKYRKEEDRIIGRKYHNGKLFPYDSVEIKHWQRAEYQAVFEEPSKNPVDHECTRISTYANGNAMVIVKDRYYECVGAHGSIRSIQDYTKDDFDDIADRKYCNRSLLDDCYPFTGTLQYYFTRDGAMYARSAFCPSSNLDIIYFIDGDMQYGVTDRRSDGVDYEYRGDILSCNEYTDLINDTNVEFLGFAWTPYGKWFSLPEYSSDWYPMRSKHLIKYEMRQYPTSRQRMADIKERYPEYYEQEWGSKDVKCNSEWDYEFDSSGNLVRIDFIHHDWFNNHCVINIQYVE